jgi:iron complex outermembrane receptor protein
VPFEVGTFNNDSPAAKLWNSTIKQEESQSASIGTAKP